MYPRVSGAPLDFVALRAELEVPGDFGPDVLADAARATSAVMLPDEGRHRHPVRDDRPIRQSGSRPGAHIARDGDGYLVSYAIADVAAFVVPGSALDIEAHRRGETLYFPDVRVPLHPPLLSEGAASLLPGVLRPEVLWQIALAADATVRSTEVCRAACAAPRNWTTTACKPHGHAVRCLMR